MNDQREGSTKPCATCGKSKLARYSQGYETSALCRKCATVARGKLLVDERILQSVSLLPNDVLKEKLKKLYMNTGFQRACRMIAAETRVPSSTICRRAEKMGLKWIALPRKQVAKHRQSIEKIINGPARQEAIRLFEDAKFDGTL